MMPWHLVISMKDRLHRVTIPTGIGRWKYLLCQQIKASNLCRPTLLNQAYTGQRPVCLKIDSVQTSVCVCVCVSAP